MKLTTPKINHKSLLQLGLRLLLVLLIAYEGYLLFGIYASLNKVDTEILKSSRSTIDLVNFKKASDRYSATFDYAPPADEVPNPFVMPPKPTQ